MADSVNTWLPWKDPQSFLGGLPERVQATYYAGGELDQEPDQVEFYVPSYMGSSRAVEVISEMPNLKVVQTQTAGFENVLPYLPDGVTLCNARGVHDASTAELAVALILASYRRIPTAVVNQQQGIWPADPGIDDSLADRTVLILGYGSIGEALERRLAGFECDIIRVARRARDGVAPITELPALLPRADVVVLLTPATEETKGLVDAQFLGRMKDGALLVNVARGVVVNTGDLVAELGKGRIRAALDVTDPEPLPAGHPLWSAPNVLVNPHRGGASTAFPPRVARLVRAQLERYVTGEPLINVVAGPPR
ncbi:2-hydroxyacid dehydrogenase [Kribbella sp. CA-253562]|uniref:2-hydroxyacid dehydrogenase n=1 Tax=Kribbella sp. CA-253562 TaxID=3239942 RepID=UPI003D8C4197